MALRNRRALGTFQIIKLVWRKFRKSEIAKGITNPFSSEYIWEEDDAIEDKEEEVDDGLEQQPRNKIEPAIDVHRYVSAGLVSDNNPEMRKR